MADESKRKIDTPVLDGQLTPGEQVMLHQVIHHGGFKVLLKIFDAVCNLAKDDALRLDPEEPTYDHKLAIRVQRGRNFAECVDLANKSVVYHTQQFKDQVVAEDHEAVESVKKVFGINFIKKVKEVPAVPAI